MYNGIVVQNDEEVLAHTKKLEKLVEDFNKEICDYNMYVAELDGLGKGIGKVREVMQDVKKLMDDAEEITHDADTTMNMHISANKQYSEVNINL